MHIFGSHAVVTGNPDSRLKFETDYGSAGIGNRYLLIDGKRAYNLGINCQTCSLLFVRMEGANQSVEIEKTADALRQGVAELSDPVVEAIGLGLPQGEYLTFLGESPVRIVYPQGEGDYFSEDQIALWGEDRFWCLPHDPRVPYFRAGEMDIGKSRRLYNFIVPMYPTRWLTFRERSVYEEEMSVTGSGTAVGVSILDVRGPADYECDPDPLEHWCFTHYLIDGHHKLHAASELDQRLKILSFVAIGQCAASREQIEQAIGFLKTSTAD